MIRPRDILGLFGKPYHDARPSALASVDLDVAAVSLDEGVHDRQTEAAPEPAPGPAAAKPQGLRLPPAPGC